MWLCGAYISITQLELANRFIFLFVIFLLTYGGRIFTIFGVVLGEQQKKKRVNPTFIFVRRELILVFIFVSLLIVCYFAFL